MTLEIASKSDLPNCVHGNKRRAIARRKITRWASHRISVEVYLPAFFMALSSCLSADCTSLTHLRAFAATFFISCTSPRAIAPRIGSPYGGNAPVSGLAATRADFFVDDFFVVFFRAGIETSVSDG